MITIDDRQLLRAHELLKYVPNGVQKATATALNRAINGAKSDAAKKVASRYTVTQAYVRDRLAKPRLATLRMLSASIGVTSRPRNLASFKMNLRDAPRGKGARTLERNKIKVSVLKGGRVKPLRRHFLMKVNNVLLIAMRAGGRTQKASRPLAVRSGPSISQMLGSDVVVKEIEQKAQVRLKKNLDHEIKRVLEGNGKWSQLN